ncbi:MAG: MCP four helix bundle domain-containing protein [Bdellovibrionaceae bacterium]|nr:MCP four helix bundle domain-containing protein [Pseudobdellovibrionaceae bacterium]
MFSNSSLKVKLGIAFGVVALFLVVVASVSVYSLIDVAKNFGHVARVNLPNLQRLAEMDAAQHTLRIFFNRLSNPMDDSKKVPFMIEKVKKAMEDYDAADKAYNEIPFVEGEAELYNAQNEIAKKTRAMAVRLLEISQKREEWINNKEHPLSGEYYSLIQKEFIPATIEHEKRMDLLMDFQNKKEAPKWVQLAEDTGQRGILISIVCAILGFVLASLIGLRFSTSLSRQLSSVANQLFDGATQVASASGQISKGAQSMAATSIEQASSVEETSASVQEITGMVENNTKNAESSLQLSRLALAGAEKGTATMDQLLAAMNEVLDSNKKIEGLVKVIEEIGEKTVIIDEIVFQTKLLSFNASVEAERAGELGRGFAVVAQEVGNLAQMSGKAAMEISAIVKSSIKDAQSISGENRERVEKSSDFAKSALTLIKELRANAQSVLDATGQIVNASKEQTLGLRQIGKAMTTLNQVTQDTAANAEESSAAAQQLTAQAESVNHIVASIK